MATTEINEAKAHFSKLLARVEEGESLVITRRGKPVAELIPFREKTTPRKLGILSGDYWEADDCWTDVDKPIKKLFEGTDILPPDPVS